MIDWLSGSAAAALANGLAVTVVITVLTSTAAFLMAAVVTGLRVCGRRGTRLVSGVYIEVFRNVPALIQIIFWAFAVPTLFAPETRRVIFFDNVVIDRIGTVTGLSIPYYALAACLALTLNTSAHLGEILRSGVESVDDEHRQSARSLGATRFMAYRSVLLPAGLRTSFPALSTRLIHNMKNTALVSFVAVPDLFHETQATINETFRATEFLLAAGFIYLALSLVMTGVLHAIDRAMLRGNVRGHASVTSG